MLNSNLIFAERLKELMRERNEMTPTELAHALNCDKHAVSRWIHGANFPRFATLIKMTEFFNISIDFLLGLSDEETLNRLHTNTIFLDRLNLLLK